MSTITRDEWLRELERVMLKQGPQANGLTAKELADQWGCCRRVALERLQLLRDRLVVGSKRSSAISGRTTLVPCYRLTPLTRAQRGGLYRKAAKKR